MKQPLKLLPMAILLLLSACKDKDSTTTTPTNNNTSTTGAKVGTKWVYLITKYDDTLGTKVRGTQEVTYTVTKDTTIGSDTWLVLSTGSSTEYLRYGTDGHYTMVGGAPQLEFKFGAIGDSYTVKLDDNTTNTRKIVANSESVTVPAGTFTAYKTESYDSNSLEDYHWYNKEQFLIKQTEFDASPVNPSAVIVDYTVELKSYTY